MSINFAFIDGFHTYYYLEIRNNQLRVVTDPTSFQVAI